VTQRAATTTQP